MYLHVACTVEALNAFFGTSQLQSFNTYNRCMNTRALSMPFDRAQWPLSLSGVAGLIEYANVVCGRREGQIAFERICR